MEVFIRGKGKVKLDPSDYSQGGEAKVWFKDGVVYKIYHEQKHMIPQAKIQELQAIKVSHVCKPVDVILDKKDRSIGFTMDAVEGNPLISLYTTGFQNNNGISNENIIDLVEEIKKTVQLVHRAGCLIVDMNELNVIVESNWVIPNFIDVNSWQTPSFPATAIAPNIRDYTSKDFTELTDWFSFAIITCYLFTGIHPFRGSHKAYRRNDVESRIKDSVSIFNSDVKLPAAVRSFDLIPDNYKKWYIQLFDGGMRIEPPMLAGVTGAVSVTITLMKGTKNFEIKLIREFDDDVVYHRNIFGNDITRTKKHLFIEGVSYRVNAGVDLIITPKLMKPLLVKIENGALQFKCAGDPLYEIKSTKIAASRFFIINNSLFVVNSNILSEIDFTDMKDKTLASISSSCELMNNASIFNGVVYQQIMGKPYIVFPVPRDGQDCLFVERSIPELEDYKIINAKQENGVVVLTCFRGSTYDTIVLRFSKDFGSYHCRGIGDVDLTEPNFTVLDNGQVVCIPPTEQLELFRRDPAYPHVAQFDDSDINSTMRLCKSGISVRFFQGNKLYSIKKK